MDSQLSYDEYAFYTTAKISTFKQLSFSYFVLENSTN